MIENSEIHKKRNEILDNMEAAGFKFLKSPSCFDGLLAAYSDWHDMPGVARNLDYVDFGGFTGMDVPLIAQYVMPQEYNAYSSTIFKKIHNFFGMWSTYYFGRESSVVVYVKPDHAICLRELMQHAKKWRVDELSYQPDKGVFRLWWD